MNVRTWMIFAALFAVLGMVSTGCILAEECDPAVEVCDSGETGSEVGMETGMETGSETGESCIPGQEGACDCGDDTWSGSATCGDDGLWSECVCGEIEYCIEGETQDCECDGDAGSALCDADGLWGECVCEEVCVADAWCNPGCYDVNIQLPTDPDCNPNVPENADKADNDTSPNNCDCDYWGFVCEAAAHCSNLPCECDNDCNYPDGMVAACNSDGHCDSWCVTNYDPDCVGNTEKNGKYCDEGGGGENLSCDQNFGQCDADFGNAQECAADPDCDGLDLPCEADDWCDTKCPAGADSDC